MHFAWLATGSCFFVSRYALALLVNATIDDTYGDPLTGNLINYDPPDAWNNGICQSCSGQPDHSEAFNDTWHESIFNPSGKHDTVPNATVTFNGRAVYVFCIIEYSGASPEQQSDMSFFIDGEAVGNFTSPPPETGNFSYNVPVYANDSLTSRNHTLQISNGHINGEKSVLLLDYITYSYDEESDSPSSQPSPSTSTLHHSSSSGPKTAVIVVMAVVGVSLVAGIGFFCARYLRRRRRPPPDPTSVIEPFAASFVQSRSGSAQQDNTRVAGAGLYFDPDRLIRREQTSGFPSSTSLYIRSPQSPTSRQARVSSENLDLTHSPLIHYTNGGPSHPTDRERDSPVDVQTQERVMRWMNNNYASMFDVPESQDDHPNQSSPHTPITPTATRRPNGQRRFTVMNN